MNRIKLFCDECDGTGRKKSKSVYSNCYYCQGKGWYWQKSYEVYDGILWDEEE